MEIKTLHPFHMHCFSLVAVLRFRWSLNKFTNYPLHNTRFSVCIKTFFNEPCWKLQSFVMSVVVGDDLVPRLSMNSLHDLRYKIMCVLNTCRQPKVIKIACISVLWRSWTALYESKGICLVFAFNALLIVMIFLIIANVISLNFNFSWHPSAQNVIYSITLYLL